MQYSQIYVDVSSLKTGLKMTKISCVFLIWALLFFSGESLVFTYISCVKSQINVYVVTGKAKKKLTLKILNYTECHP